MAVMLENLLKNSIGEQIEHTGDINIPVEEICTDSRQVTQGALFVAIPGTQASGTQFIEQALRRGASAAVVPQEELAELETTLVPTGFPLIPVPDTRLFAGAAADILYNHPSKHLELIGITGTNGKTTITWLLEAIFHQAHKNPGVIGTINCRYNGCETPASLTTPDAVSLQKGLADMRDAGVDACLLEVSSHALEQQRVAGCRFKAAIFTNLSRDHLDYHRDMDAYFQAKKLLFTRYTPEFSIINLDDRFGRRLVRELEEQGIRHVTFGINTGDIHAEEISADLSGIRALIKTPSGKFNIDSHLVGIHNLSNILAAAAAAHCLGIEHDAISRGISRLENVPGRLEPVNIGKDIRAFIDYAHTPDALEKVLSALKDLTPGRLVTVIGCGGDRDRGKRPIMARVAASISDKVFLTSDNPRTEPPHDILDDMIAGLDIFSTRAEVRVIPDRAVAIREAVCSLKKQDCIIVAGKGHEDYQIIGRDKIPFDDRKEVLKASRCISAAESAENSAEQPISSPLYPKLTLADVAEAAGAVSVKGNSDSRFTGISTDTRTLKTGELFWALRGENFDGNRFSETALKAGASGAVIDEAALEYLDIDTLTAIPGDPCIIVVRDTLEALGEFARFFRKKLDYKVAGITGSCGKTSTRSLVAFVAATMYPVAETRGNFNNLIGLPLSMLSASAGTMWGIFEMGMNQPGEMHRLCSISMPDIGIITNIRKAHLEGLGTLKAIAEQKWELWKALPEHGTAIINLDDRLVVQGARYLKCASIVGWSMKSKEVLNMQEVISYSPAKSHGSSIPDTLVTCDSWQPDGSGTRIVCTITGKEGKSRKLTIRLPLPGEANVQNALAAVAAGIAMNIPLEQITQGLEKASGVPGRLEYVPLANGWVIISDFYNANPASMAAALSTLAVYAGTRRRVAILGDMLELGAEAETLHQELGISAADAGVDLLLAAGEYAREIAAGACRAGLPDAGIRLFPDTDALCEWLKDRAVTLIPENAALLVKGSRGMRLEQAVSIIENIAGGRSEKASPASLKTGGNA